jgi:hypothetical protein
MLLSKRNKVYALITIFMIGLSTWILSPFGTGKLVGARVVFYLSFLNFLDNEKSIENELEQTMKNKFAQYGYYTTNDFVANILGLPQITFVIDDGTDLDKQIIKTNVRSTISVALTPYSKTTETYTINSFKDPFLIEPFKAGLVDALNKHIEKLFVQKQIQPNIIWYWALYALPLSCICLLLRLFAQHKIANILLIAIVLPLSVLIALRLAWLAITDFFLSFTPKQS